MSAVSREAEGSERLRRRGARALGHGEKVANRLAGAALNRDAVIRGFRVEGSVPEA